MKTIKIPEDVSLTDQMTISFRSWMLNNVLVDAKFGKNIKMIYKGLDMKQSLEKLSDGEDWEVGEENYEILKDVVENPSIPMNPAAIYKMMSFIEAVTKVE